MTPEVSQALGRLFSVLNLTPPVREEILKQVPDTAETISDLPEHLQWLIAETTKDAPAATTRAAGRTLTLAGRRLAFALDQAAMTQAAMHQVALCDDDMDFPHPDDTGEGHRRLPEHWRGLLVPYDVMAPDGRIIAMPPRGLPQSREMPLPLTAQVATADGHDNSVPIGRVTRIWSQDGALWGEGDFDLGTPEGRDWAGRIGRGMAGWGSVDLDAGRAPRVESRGSQRVPRKTYKDWSFAGFTLVTRPAFDAARITPYYPDGDAPPMGGDCKMWDPQTGRCMDDDAVDDPRHTSMPMEVEEVLADIDVDASTGNCGCGGAAETGQSFPAGGKAGLPMADRGQEWDEAAATGRVRDWADGDWTKYGQAFFWHADEPTSAADFKLPFADVVDGRLTAVPRGVFAAAAAVQGARAPLKGVSPTDMEMVKSKISAYYRKLKMAAPWDSKAEASAMLAHEPVLVAGGEYAGRVVGFDATGGWLRIACDNGTELICSGDEVAHADALTASVGGGPIAPDATWFTNPNLSAPTPLQVREDGHVYGHLALWGSCHVGFADTCVTAPRSATDYASFHVGEVVTASGDRLPVGKITIGGGHANAAAGWRAAAAHYDNTGAAVAVVRVGEDAHGIWFAGALVPEATSTQVAALRRSPLSGDWRRIGGSMELVAALAVNTPGFPVPRPRAGMAAARQASLTAAGVLDPQEHALTSRLHDIVAQAMEGVLDGYAARRERAAAAAARISAASSGSVCTCGQCPDADDQDDEFVCTCGQCPGFED